MEEKNGIPTWKFGLICLVIAFILNAINSNPSERYDDYKSNVNFNYNNAEQVKFILDIKPEK